MDIVTIQRRLVDLDLFMTKTRIAAIIDAIETGIESGKLIKSDGYYLPVQFFKVVLGKCRSAWTKLTVNRPEILEHTKLMYFPEWRGRTKIGTLGLTYFGLFYAASIVGFARNGTLETTAPPNIYVLRDAANKALKVGFSNNFDQRFKHWKNHHPFVRTLALFAVEHIRDEKMLHKFLDAHRLDDTLEWYPDTIEVREKINRFLLDRGIIENPDPALAADAPIDP